MRKLLYTAVAAAAFTLGSMANAAVVVTTPSPAIYTPPTSGGLIGNVAAGATSNDTFSFSVAGNSNTFFSGQLSNTALTPGGPGNINFSNILLDGVAGLFSLVTIPGAAETWACCQPAGNGAIVLAPGDHRLTFTVTNTSTILGTYTGSFNFAAVPEPSTWAMMLLGFGGIGLAMRRRRSPALAQIA